MTPLGFKNHRPYLDRLFGSHDFSVSVQVLNRNEKPLGTAVFLDGQVNLIADGQIRRTCSLTVSDPEGALDFNESAIWSPRTIWADRLVRVRHSLWVPGQGEVRTTVFVGPPSTIERSGADVTVECQDKTALANRGSRPMTVHKGMNAVDAIEKIMRERTGEFRFRMPRSKRRLSRPYAVGWADEASPWEVCQRIARHELHMQLLYSADGYLLLRRKPKHVSLTVPHVTGLPSNSADFTELDNWVKVSGHVQSKTKNRKGGGSVTTTKQPVAIARIKPGKTFSPEWLARKDVPIYWPALVDADKARKVERVKQIARDTLRQSDRLEDSPAVTCVPFFHGDADDLVRVRTPEDDLVVRLGDCSIPLGVGGDMTIGAHRWVSHHQPSRTRGRIVRTTKVKRSKKKGGGDK